MAIKPHFSKFDFEHNCWVFGLDDDDFQMVQQGYACGECLEDFRGEFKLRCPVCGHSTTAGDRVILDTPAEWR